jgi:hypothetical protein
MRARRERNWRREREGEGEGEGEEERKRGRRGGEQERTVVCTTGQGSTGAEDLAGRAPGSCARVFGAFLILPRRCHGGDSGMDRDGRIAVTVTVTVTVHSNNSQHRRGPRECTAQRGTVVQVITRLEERERGWFCRRWSRRAAL